MIINLSRIVNPNTLGESWKECFKCDLFILYNKNVDKQRDMGITFLTSCLKY